MRKEQTSHKNEHNTLKCFPLEPVFTRDKGGLPNFIDEPTAGLDVIARDELLNLLREYMEQDERAILISSHISSDLEGLCDDVYMIDDGKIVMHTETDILLSDYGLLKVTDDQYQKLEKEYIIRHRKEEYGYSCLTDQKQFYMENYPGLAIEKGSIDEVMTMMIRGEK